MKIFKAILVLTISLFYGTSALCQEKSYKEKAYNSRNLVDKSSIEEVKKENVDLQSFVESIYINSSKFYNQALPAIKKGEYDVLINRGDDLGIRPIKTKDLKDISIDEIEEFAFKKSITYTALYGSFSDAFGIVILKLKQPKNSE